MQAMATTSPSARGGAAKTALPEQPLQTIRARTRWVPLDVRELWSYRELLYYLTWRDVNVRYKQTLLGAAWAILQPLATMVIFTLFFGKLAKMPSDNIPYPLFAYAGLLPWTFFSNAVTNAGNSLIVNSNLITKVYFPRMVIPGAAVAAGLVDFAVAMVTLVAMMGYYHVMPSVQVFLVIPLIALTVLGALGVGLYLAALNVRYRDIRYALPFIIQLWMFVTPIIYPTSIIPERWRWLLALNPLTGLIDGFRQALFGTAVAWHELGISVVVTFLLLTYSAFAFRSMERNFADIV
jgi:lipopolysaccharide transport system permease protein